MQKAASCISPVSPSIFRFKKLAAAGEISEKTAQSLQPYLTRQALEETLYLTPDQVGFFNGLTQGYHGFLVGKHPDELAKHLVWPEEEHTSQVLLALVAEGRALYGSHVAEYITEALAKQNAFGPDQARSFRLALHESLINAIEHGNLGLSGTEDRKVDKKTWLDKYYDRVEKLLASPAGDKPIAIFVLEQNNMLRVWIEDSGTGFDTVETYRSLQQTKVSGRGLALIQALTEKVAHDKDGRRFYFEMACQESESRFAPPSRLTAKQQGRILIVDDQKINRTLAQQFLANAGYANIEMAVDGHDALEKVETFQPHLILMDIIMPEMDGFEACRALKANPATADIPILFMSGLTDTNSRTQGYRLGAVDYVSKPIERNELVARTEVHILNGMMLQAMQQFSQRLMQDLENARRFQYSLLPEPAEVQTISQQYKVKINSHFHPCDELAGDYWSLLPVNKETLGFTMVDFTGHGVLAALNTIRLHAFFHELEPLAADPLLLVSALNERLHDMLTVDQFATLLYGTLNTRTGALTYVSCGAPAPAIVPQQEEADITLLPSAGLPLGILAPQQFKPTLYEATLNPDDTLLLYSDALVETPHSNDTMWADETLKDMLTSCHAYHEGRMPLLTCLLRRFNKTAQKPLKDDLTLLTIQR